MSQRRPAATVRNPSPLLHQASKVDPGSDGRPDHSPTTPPVVGGGDGTIEEFPLAALPPLLQAEGSRSGESCLGICVVGIIVALLVGITHVIAAPQGPPIVRGKPVPLAPAEAQPPGPHWGGQVACIFIDLWALIALACLVRILVGDMGEVRRNAQNTYPIPEKVADRLRSGQSFKGLWNVDGEGGRTYCVRCLVWRPANSNAHHCSTCQRCTTGFDHHCGVYGRCIAWGQGGRGNMIYFITILLMFAAGIFTFVLSAVTRPARPRMRDRYPRGMLGRPGSQRPPPRSPA